MRIAILWVTVPATIMQSDWRGVARGINPRRSQSKRLAPVAIISIAQQARPNVIGQIAESRAQLTTALTVVSATLSLPRPLPSAPIRSTSTPGHGYREAPESGRLAR